MFLYLTPKERTDPTLLVNMDLIQFIQSKYIFDNSMDRSKGTIETKGSELSVITGGSIVVRESTDKIMELLKGGDHE